MAIRNRERNATTFGGTAELAASRKIDGSSFTWCVLPFR